MRTRCLFCTDDSSFSLSLCFEEPPFVSCLYTVAMVQGGKICKKGIDENLFTSNCLVGELPLLR